MIKWALFLGIVLTGASVHAQHRVTFVLEKRPAQHPQDTVWLAGSFNGWNPGHAEYVLGLTHPLIVSLKAGNYQFKCTRGTWQKTECGTNGQDVGNRNLIITSDTTILLDIAAWKDDFSAPAKQHTASTGVTLLSDSFYMPGLNRYRRIWVYLPPDYASSSKRYPVLYMHDGQNLFDEQIAPFGEWGVDECLDSLAHQGIACIVVGIDNGGDKRMSEYNPYLFRDFDAEGRAYVDFLAERLKPFIDKRYRTQPGEATTSVAGSSMGGLISLYAVLRHPDVFGSAGIFSPAFWTAPELDDYIDSLANRVNARLFFYAGEQESKEMVPDMERIAVKLALQSNYFMYYITDPEGQHNERTWRKWLPVFFKWMYANRAE